MEYIQTTEFPEKNRDAPAISPGTSLLPTLRPIGSPCTQECQRHQLLGSPVLVSGRTDADWVPWCWIVMGRDATSTFQVCIGF